MAVQISKKRKFVADGIFKAELNEFLTRELAEDGYSGVEVRVTPTRTEIIILATRTQNVLGEKGRRIRELTAVVQKRHPPCLSQCLQHNRVLAAASGGWMLSCKDV
ncbi:rCG40478, isoform CRA_c [Rattus norvegicus]|uniref:RCG40478, isoform CRA_c n=1 Tax=Rattus norvegicus TaxID=10116 RepID=A6I6H9_RAT|nr:rCG40478, isoform CRA_c [Rattus norvegicus]